MVLEVCTKTDSVEPLQRFDAQILKGAMILVHPFIDNFSDNLVFLSFYWLKTIEREREKERDMITRSCEYERESCSKVVIKWLYRYHISFKSLDHLCCKRTRPNFINKKWIC